VVALSFLALNLKFAFLVVEEVPRVSTPTGRGFEPKDLSQGGAWNLRFIAIIFSG
jgi:hypothetical protein